MNYLKFLIFIFILWSCNILDPNEEIPAFIEIDEMTLDTRQPGDPGYSDHEGTSSSDIRDVWVFVDDNLDGVYELPARIPISTGQHDLRISAGIFNNGVANDRVIYPFYDDQLSSIDLVEGEVMNFVPSVQYFENTPTFWHEEFEEASVKIENLPFSDVGITSIFDSSIAFEGEGCGSIQLTDTEDLYQGQTIANLNIGVSTPLYLELNYKNTNRFFLGMRNDFSDSNETALAGFNPSLNENGEAIWKKAYVYFTPILSSLGTEGDFEIFIEASKEVDNPLILLDNLKIVYSN